MADSSTKKTGEVARRAASAHSLADRTILLVDDDPANIQHVREGLAGPGYRFREANDGTEALRSLREVRPDLIIMDVEMPRLGGVEVCRIIKANAEHGWGDYRAPPLLQDDVAEVYGWNNHVLRRFNETMKDAIDPNGILSPGRGGIWPKAHRSLRGGLKS